MYIGRLRIESSGVCGFKIAVEQLYGFFSGV